MDQVAPDEDGVGREPVVCGAGGEPRVFEVGVEVANGDGVLDLELHVCELHLTSLEEAPALDAIGAVGD